MINVILSVKSTVYAKDDYNWNLSTFICENSWYLKSVAYNLVLAHN